VSCGLKTQSTFDATFWLRPDFEHSFLKPERLVGGSMQLASAYLNKMTDRQLHHDSMFISIGDASATGPSNEKI
jgi:hypothetical protein